MEKVNLRSRLFFLAIMVVVISLFYMFSLTSDTARFPSWMVIFYVTFFWFFWFYARTEIFSDSLLERDDLALPRGILLLGSIFVVCIYFSLKSNLTNSKYDSRAPIMGILSLQYLLIALICVFGDRFLGVFGRLLKKI